MADHTTKMVFIVRMTSEEVRQLLAIEDQAALTGVFRANSGDVTFTFETPETPEVGLRHQT